MLFPSSIRAALKNSSVKTVLKYSKLSFFGGVATSIAFTTPAKFEKPTPKHPTTFTKKSLINLESLPNSSFVNLPLKILKVKAPLYPNERIAYEGYDLLDLLASLKIKKKPSEAVFLQAKDGFETYIDDDELLNKYRPILAFRQKSAPVGHNWITVTHSLSRQTDGGPFYLIWPDEAKDEIGDNDWPFGVTKIGYKVHSLVEKIYPITSDADIKEGAKLFARNCSSCHKISGLGTANVAPDFKYIVEQHPEEGSIAAYALNPPFFSRMPPQKLIPGKLFSVEKFIRYHLKNYTKEEAEPQQPKL